MIQSKGVIQGELINEIRPCQALGTETQLRKGVIPDGNFSIHLSLAVIKKKCCEILSLWFFLLCSAQVSLSKPILGDLMPKEAGSVSFTIWKHLFSGSCTRWKIYLWPMMLPFAGSPGFMAFLAIWWCLSGLTWQEKIVFPMKNFMSVKLNSSWVF